MFKTSYKILPAAETIYSEKTQQAYNCSHVVKFKLWWFPVWFTDRYFTCEAYAKNYVNSQTKEYK